MVEKKPNFIIIGAMKAATTSLYTYIKQHPDIFMTKVKEPMFFNNFQQENNYNILGSKSKKATTLEEYLAMFKDAKNEKAIGEASPFYISESLKNVLLPCQTPARGIPSQAAGGGDGGFLFSSTRSVKI